MNILSLRGTDNIVVRVELKMCGGSRDEYTRKYGMLLVCHTEWVMDG